MIKKNTHLSINRHISTNIPIDTNKTVRLFPTITTFKRITEQQDIWPPTLGHMSKALAFLIFTWIRVRVWFARGKSVFKKIKKNKIFIIRFHISLNIIRWMICLSSPYILYTDVYLKRTFVTSPNQHVFCHAYILHVGVYVKVIITNFS